MTPEKQIEEQAANPLPQYNDVPPVRFGEHDDFDREIIADNIIKLLDSELTDCYPMAIDGGWGTGKSEFCHKLINKMRDSAESCEKRNIIYFDAFEAENVEEPLLSLLAKITEVVPEAEKKPLISKIVPVAKYGLGVTLKGLANHILRQNGDALSEGFHEAFADGVTSGIDKLLKEYSQAKTHLQSLKDCIEQSLKTKELVIFVDELDRCRPDFALNVFELVKHVFDIEGVKFVFIVNSEQIKAMIKNRYGEGVDTDVYLEKFISRTVHLADFSSSSKAIHQYNSIKLIYEFGIKNNIKSISGQSVFDLIIRNIYNEYTISLRSSNEIVKNYKIYNKISIKYKIEDEIPIGYELLVSIGVILYTIDNTSSANIINDKFDYNKISNTIEVSGDDITKIYLTVIKDAIKNGKSFNCQTYNNYSNNYNYFMAVRELFGNCTFNEAQDIIRHVIKTLNFCG